MIGSNIFHPVHLFFCFKPNLPDGAGKMRSRGDTEKIPIARKAAEWYDSIDS